MQRCMIEIAPHPPCVEFTVCRVLGGPASAHYGRTVRDCEAHAPRGRELRGMFVQPACSGCPAPRARLLHHCARGAARSYVIWLVDYGTRDISDTPIMLQTGRYAGSRAPAYSPPPTPPQKCTRHLTPLDQSHARHRLVVARMRQAACWVPPVYWPCCPAWVLPWA